MPFEQIIFVGDGDSDLPAFALMRERGGCAIAVRQAPEGEWESRDDIRPGREVEALVQSDFTEGSPLMTALAAAAQRAALRVRLLRAGR